MYPTEPFVRSVLGPYEPEICRRVRTAWAKLAALPGRASFDFKRTVATLMHQFVMNEIRDAFDGSRGDVRFLEGNETIRLLIDRRLVVRLKKMDQRGYTRALPTQATLALTTPDAPLPFSVEDMPDVCTADVGYVLNELETRIDVILVAARHGEAVLWSYAANESGAVADATIAPSPMLSPSPARIIKLPVKPPRESDSDKR